MARAFVIRPFGAKKDNTPFDILTDCYLSYDIGNPGATKDELIETITASRKSERETGSFIFQMLPNCAIFFASS